MLTSCKRTSYCYWNMWSHDKDVTMLRFEIIHAVCLLLFFCFINAGLSLLEILSIPHRGHWQKHGTTAIVSIISFFFIPPLITFLYSTANAKNQNDMKEYSKQVLYPQFVLLIKSSVHFSLNLYLELL